jgi:hypothetical protein
MHAVTLSQFMDRQLLQPPISPNLLEQLHPRPHPDRPPSQTTTGTI